MLPHAGAGGDSGVYSDGKETDVPAVASLEDLRAVARDLETLKTAHPQAYQDAADLVRRHRKVGFKNICKLLLGESTPEKLKEA
jgi:hypothetical protein